MSLPPRLMVVAGVRLYRDGLATGLQRTGRVEVAGCASGFELALAMVRRDRPAAVLLDMEMGWSLPFTARLRREACGPAVIALAVPERESAIVAYAEAGVTGFVPRDASLEELIEIVMIVGRGEAACPPRVAASLLRRIMAQAAGGPQVLDPPVALTGRESEIIALLEQGLANKEIAAKLCIEVATVKNHVHNILGKLGVKRRGEAAARFRRLAAAG
jgi:two-component system, NarL family, nitrate/nitrite response regulator NarL